MKKIAFKFFFYIVVSSALCIGAIVFRHPTVSVVMPVYNRETLVERAIQSVLEQSFKDFEFIIVDDGSTDSTPDILQKYARKDKRVRVLTNDTNRGISYSRNRGNDAARGKYIAVMDSDDIATPNRLLKTVRFLETHPDITAVSGNVESVQFWKTAQLPSVSDEPSISKNSDFYRIEMMFMNRFQNVTALFRRRFIKQNHIRYDENYISAEDYQFWWQILQHNGKLVALNEVFAFIRLHTTNTSVYYKEMMKNAKRVRKQQLERFFPVTIDALPYTDNLQEQCDRLAQIKQANAVKHILPETALKQFMDTTCPAERTSYFLKHTNWSDFLVKDQAGNYKLFTHPDNIKDVIEKDNQLTVIWRDYLPETFVKQDRSWVYQPPEGDLEIRHPDWRDFLIYDSKTDLICRIGTHDCGTAVFNKAKNTLQIKWRRYKSENFRRNPKDGIWDLDSGKSK